jgi:hypothetical protein
MVALFGAVDSGYASDGVEVRGEVRNKRYEIGNKIFRSKK